MPFKFNFNSEVEIPEEPDPEIPHSVSEIGALQIEVEKEHLVRASHADMCEVVIGRKTLKHMSRSAVEEQLKQSHGQVAKTITDMSDLLPGVYEGGLKIWECSVDLAEFLESSGINFKDMRVLELGCGAGLPALLAYVYGATCCFQDFNREVIDLATIPNVILNSNNPSKVCNKRAMFIAGDWKSVPQILQAFPKFDIILTSETIYNRNSQENLLNIMKGVLKSNGSIYLAAKTCYFGVGGSLRQFEQLLTEDSTFKFCTVWKTEEGVKREILHITFKKTD